MERAYDADDNLCFLCIHDAENAAYAGYMRSILTTEELQEMFNGKSNPREELMGDVLELASEFVSHFAS